MLITIWGSSPHWPVERWGQACAKVVWGAEIGPRIGQCVAAIGPTSARKGPTSAPKLAELGPGFGRIASVIAAPAPDRGDADNARGGARWRSAPRARRRTACKCGRRGPPSRHWGAPATLAWAPAASWGRRAGCARRSRPRRAAASTVSAPGRPRSATAYARARGGAGTPAHCDGGPPLGDCPGEKWSPNHVWQ